MVVKKSSKNQISIPKKILKEVGLGPEDIYFDIGCKNGHIILRPMQFEEKISAAALERFVKKHSRRSKGDRLFANANEAIHYLKNRK